MQISHTTAPFDSAARIDWQGQVMIVEDDALLSMMMEDMIRDLGSAEVVVCTDHATALITATQGDIACAVLDVFVHGKPTYDLAGLLIERGIPVIFCSGLTRGEIDERYRHLPFLPKPYSDEELRECLIRALAHRTD